ncbi:MAG: SDR family NAD(P)-dependent oxidoreductase [Acidobacteria bacterium]|nr:SDR family NAD(P)-dependent oxidoreductase [Acidobacteriota bacterium]MDA1233699.1 SDR family NAD(P)-dependent oxidoreductase [Acidobacteriota bacterium]
MGDQKKAVLITGCSSGIGRATALRLNQSGWLVYATARRAASIEDLARAGCHTIELEVTDEASRARAVAQVEAECGSVGALINNAGYSQSGTIEETPIELIRRQFETNFFGLAALTQLVLPGMRRAGRGRIVNLGSMGGTLVFPGGGYYHATKYALEAFSDALRFEVGGLGIDVILIQPGLIRTEFSETAVASVPTQQDDSPYRALMAKVKQATKEAYTQGLAAKLAGEPDDVARTIERALAAKRPKARYRVSASARVFMWQRALLGDGGWDAFLSRHYPRPGKS